MKRHPFRRALVVVAIYIAAGLALALAQFSQTTGFTLNVGSLAVSGKYAKNASDAPSKGERSVVGPVAVFFGGMEFRFSESDGLATGYGDSAKGTKPVSLAVEEGAVRIKLADGGEVRLTTVFTGGAETLTATAVLAKGGVELRLPYRPLRSSRIIEFGKGGTGIQAGGSTFAFASSAVDGEKRLVYFKAAAPSFAYGKIVERKGFSAADFAIPQGADPAAYDKAVAKWTDAAFAAWEKAMGGSPDEDSAVAYVAESAKRGAYRIAVATAPKSFVEGDSRGYRSAPYFGRLGQGARSLLAAERETLGRISRLANERNPDLFSETDLVSYLTVRSSRTLAEDAATFARGLDPAATTPAQAVGFLECWADWRKARPDQANPFDALQDQARFVLSTLLKRSGDGVFLVADGRADLALSLKAGHALIAAGQSSKDPSWTDVGRSLVVSVLALADQSGNLPADAAYAEAGLDPAGYGSNRVSAAKAYRLVASDKYLPKAIALPTDALPGLWAWSFAPMRITGNDSTVEISVDFPAGETHFVMLRGVKPFKKMQLYDIDFRTDTAFERYDSSGWDYMENEQVLLLKMKHKAGTERIRLFY